MSESDDRYDTHPAGHPSHLPIGEHTEGYSEAPYDDIPPIADDASPEEKDLHWYTHVYKPAQETADGQRVPQLTLRAIVMGAVLGMLMSVSNLYTTLKVGWSFGVAITACVLSYVIWNVFVALQNIIPQFRWPKLVVGVAPFRVGFEWVRVTQMSILENNCMQSTASAAGASTGATIATAFGALLILDPLHRHQPWVVVASFTLATAAMGVFLAIPMKRQMINQEKLPFPSGIAAATTLRSLYSKGITALRQAYSLVASLGVGAVVGILNNDEDQFAGLHKFFGWMKAHLFNVHLPDQLPDKGFVQVSGKSLQACGFEPSVLLIAAGMIVGLRVSLSMLASSALLYFVIVPYLAAMDAAHVIVPYLAAVDVARAGGPGYVASLAYTGGGAIAPTRWALWGGSAIMLTSSLMSLALQWKTVVRSFASLGKKDDIGSPVDENTEIQEKMAAIEVPGKWLFIGMIPITIAMLAVQVMAFQIHWWAGLIAIGMSFVLSMVACRATGETDTTPIGAMGKVMQLLFALISPGNVTHNLVSAGIAANSASSSADLLTDLKSGYLLGANPRQQFMAQFTGIFFGTLMIVPAWYLMIPNAAALDKFPLPATNTWVAVARVLANGFDSLPKSALIAAVIGGLLGCILPLLEKLFPKARPYLPSAMGLGLGWVVFFSNALAFSIGAFISWLWSIVHEKSQETYNVPIASGLVAGESLMKALLAMLATALGV